MNKLKHFFMLTFSTLLIAFGTYFFKFTNNFTFGGITGLAVLSLKPDSFRQVTLTLSQA